MEDKFSPFPIISPIKREKEGREGRKETVGSWRPKRILDIEREREYFLATRFSLLSRPDRKREASIRKIPNMPSIPRNFSLLFSLYGTKWHLPLLFPTFSYPLPPAALGFRVATFCGGSAVPSVLIFTSVSISGDCFWRFRCGFCPL